MGNRPAHGGQWPQETGEDGEKFTEKSGGSDSRSEGMVQTLTAQIYGGEGPTGQDREYSSHWLDFLTVKLSRDPYRFTSRYIVEELTLEQVIFYFCQGEDYLKQREKEIAVRDFHVSVGAMSEKGFEAFQRYLRDIDGELDFKEISKTMSESMLRFLGRSEQPQSNENE